MTPLVLPATPTAELFPSLDGAAVALEALALADAIRSAGTVALAAHELAVAPAR